MRRAKQTTEPQPCKELKCFRTTKPGHRESLQVEIRQVALCKLILKMKNLKRILGIAVVLAMVRTANQWQNSTYDVSSLWDQVRRSI